MQIVEYANHMVGEVKLTPQDISVLRKMIEKTTEAEYLFSYLKPLEIKSNFKLDVDGVFWVDYLSGGSYGINLSDFEKFCVEHGYNLTTSTQYEVI